MDAAKRIEDLLFITTNLEELLEAENAALKTNHLEVVHSLLERKTALSRAYEIRVFGLKQEHDKSEYDQAVMADAKTLNEVGRRVEILIEENEKLLKVALEVSRRFMDCVAQSAKQAMPGTGAYSSDGLVGARTPAAKKQAASLALNETL